jgi:hypothetical protein
MIMQLFDMITNPVVQAQSSLFDELQDQRCGEGLGVRRDPEQMINPHRDSLLEIGKAVRGREDQLPAGPDGYLSARHPTVPYPVRHPAVDGGQSGLIYSFH